MDEWVDDEWMIGERLREREEGRERGRRGRKGSND